MAPGCPQTPDRQRLWQEGQQLRAEKPELEAVVTEKLRGLHGLWDELESTTRTKAQCLFDANRAELFAQSCSALEAWLAGVRAQLQSDDYGKDLTSVNILLKKQQVGGQGWGAEERAGLGGLALGVSQLCPGNPPPPGAPSPAGPPFPTIPVL